MVLVLCTPSDDGLHLYQNLSSAVLKFRKNTIYILKISKGHNFNKCRWNKCLCVSMHQLKMLYICIKFYKISLILIK